MSTRDKVIALRRDNPAMRAAAIAKKLKVSRQRVQQILKGEDLPTKVGVPISRPEYRRWWNMLDRCLNPDHADFKHYGGRGITVCERWRRVENFLVDMGPLPGAQYTLERRDNDGPYSPTNCYWATKKQQGRNTRHCKLTATQVAEIKAKYAAGAKQIRLAKEYDVSQMCISNVVRGRTWS